MTATTTVKSETTTDEQLIALGRAVLETKKHEWYYTQRDRGWNDCLYDIMQRAGMIPEYE